MTAPVRLQLSRKKGFHLQRASMALNGRPALNISRPGPLGNPFVVGADGTRAECVRLHGLLLAGLVAITCKASIESQYALMNYVAENLKSFRGRNVACWCPPDAPCHGDNYLKLFNRPICREVKP